MKNLSELEQSIRELDEFERAGGTIEVLPPRGENDRQMIALVKSAPDGASDDESGSGGSLYIAKSSAETEPLEIDLDAYDDAENIPDAYIDDKVMAINRITMERLNITPPSVENKGGIVPKTRGGEVLTATEYPIIGKRGPGRDYILAADYTYRAKDKYTITAHRGFVTDLASVPRVFWVFINPGDLSLAAPIIHDLLYRGGGVLAEGRVVEYRTFDRAQSDLLFLEIMRKEEVASWRCRASYLAVRAFGWRSWQAQEQ